MRKVKESFMQKKLEQSEKEGLLKLELKETIDDFDRRFRYDSVVMALSFSTNITFGNYLVTKDAIYNTKENMYLMSTLDYKKIVETGYALADRHVIAKIIDLKVFKELLETMMHIEIVRDDVEEIIKKSSMKETEFYIDELTKSKRDVIYMKSDKFLEVDVENFKPDDLILHSIPFDNFFLAWVDKVAVLGNEENKNAKIIVESVFAEVKKVDKNNVDELLFEFFERHYKKDDGNKLTERALEAYDSYYSLVQQGYFIFIVESTEFQTILLPNGEISGTGVGNLGKKLSYLMQYVNREINQMADKDKIEMEFFTTESIVKGRWKQEQRKSCIVKGHIRRYKSGKVTLVRPHHRSGFNDNSGICIKF